MKETDALPTITRLSDAEREHALATIAELEQLMEDLAKRRGNEPSPPSWKLLNDLRDERTRDLTDRRRAPAQ